MQKKFEDMVELVEINRKKISNMFTGKAANLDLAHQCMLEIKSLLQQLFENNQYTLLAKALKDFEKTTSLANWPVKKKFTDEHREVLSAITPMFSVSILDIDKILTNDPEFNRECIERSHFEMATYFEKGLMVATAMKKLFANHEFDTLDIYIEKTENCHLSNNDIREVSYFALIDCIIKSPDDKFLEDHYIKNIIPRIKGVNLRHYKSRTNDYNAEEYIQKLVEIGKPELARFAFERLDPDSFGSVSYLKAASKVGITEINPSTGHALVKHIMLDSSAHPSDKAYVLNSVILLSKASAFDSFSNTIWFRWGTSPSLLENICSNFQGCKGNLKKKFTHVMKILINREIELCMNSGEAACEKKLKELRSHPYLGQFMETMPELQRQRLESDLSL